MSELKRYDELRAELVRAQRSDVNRDMKAQESLDDVPTQWKERREAGLEYTLQGLEKGARKTKKQNPEASSYRSWMVNSNEAQFQDDRHAEAYLCGHEKQKEQN